MVCKEKSQPKIDHDWGYLPLWKPHMNMVPPKKQQKGIWVGKQQKTDWGLIGNNHEKYNGDGKIYDQPMGMLRFII